jgi:adenine-specific DNA glycosylase
MEDNMKILQIAVGIIRNPQNQIFITQRAADAHMANKWEFPGGKSSQVKRRNRRWFVSFRKRWDHPAGRNAV